jgi:UDP-N-acetylmuramate--alanine ligase
VPTVPTVTPGRPPADASHRPIRCTSRAFPVDESHGPPRAANPLSPHPGLSIMLPNDTLRLRVDSSLNPMRMDSQAASRFTGKRVHFIGIGGSGMSGLARMLLDRGAVVSGSDPNPNTQTFELAARGARVSRDQLGELLDRSVDLVVRTAAVPDHNAEVLAARVLGLEVVYYAQLLGQVMAEQCGIAVAGTHGKSTTSAMVSYALLRCDADPSFVIGATVRQLGGGSRSGAGRHFVAEACEFNRSFHNLAPRIAIITNIEEDHLDCYRDIHEIVESFQAFARLVPADGVIVTNGIDGNVRRAIADVAAPVQYAALQPGYDWSTEVSGIENGCHTGIVRHRGAEVATLRLSIAGRHNLINATMALAACVHAGLDPAAAAAAIGEFRGADRRMTEVGRVRGAIVVDDYGHHPTEIRATLAALRERYQPRKLFCIFQPHQHSRTRFLLDDFSGSFANADETIVPDIYFVRDSESEKQKVNSQDLVERIVRHGGRAVHLPDFCTIADYIRDHAGEGDLVVTMGAGNVWEIGRELCG